MGNWLALTTCRNDGDILESFVRSNSAFIDKFVIMDDSSDNTKEICECLKREGFDIKIIQNRGIVSDQKAKTNWMLREFGDPKTFSAIVPLDVDEILMPLTKTCSKRELESSSESFFINWLPFVPTSPSPFEDPNPLKSKFLATSNVAGKVKKVFIPHSAISKKGVIDVGAHNYSSPRQSLVRNSSSEIAIGHFPVRSQEQIISKLATGLTAVRLKKKKLIGERYHLVQMLRDISKSGFLPDLEALQRMAAFYGVLESSNQASEIVFTEEGNRLPDISNRHFDLSRIQLSQNLYMLIDELTTLLTSFLGVSKTNDQPYRFYNQVRDE